MRYLSVFSIFLLCTLAGCNTGPDQEHTDKEPKKIGEFIDDWTYRVYPSYNFDTAEFRLWIPDSTKNMRAILILLNYHDSNGLGLANSKVWQEFAKEEQLGLIGVHLTGRNYSNASGGSGKALLTALEAISKKHGIEGFSNLPFLLRGYSSGGIFSYKFAAYLPKRVIAFANIRGPINHISKPDTEMPPGLMLGAENDHPGTNNSIINATLLERADGARLSYAIEPHYDHFGRLDNSDKLIRSFFSKILPKRLQEESNKLLAIPEQSGWLGNNETQEVFPFDSYPQSKDEASWLIDKEFANLWQDYQEE